MKKLNITKNDISKLIILFGIWMRGSGLASTPLWHDEAFSINMARLPLIQLIRATWLDNNPSLQYLLIKPFIYFNNPWVARIPSLLASILALAVIWEMMDDWHVTDNQRLWISALTLLPGFYWLAQDLRIFAMMGLLYLLAFWLMMGGQYIWGAVTMGLMIWGHTTGLILTVSIVIVMLIRDWMLQGMMGIRDVIYKVSAKQSITAGLVAIGIGSPALIPIILGPDVTDNPLTFNQLLDASHAALFVESLPAGWPNMAAAGIWFVYVALAMMITFTIWMDWIAKLKEPKRAELIDDDIVITNSLLAVVPIILMIVVSLLGNSIISYGALMILLWPLILWIGSATAMMEYKLNKLILPIILAAAIILAQIYWSPNIKGSDLDHYVDLINESPGEILYATGSVALPFDLYLNQQGWIARPNELMYMFGYRQRDPGPWVDWLITDEITDELEILTAEMQLVGVVEYWHMADIEIWRAQ